MAMREARPMTQNELDRLRALWPSDLKTEAIAFQLGRTTSVIKEAAARMGLGKRADARAARKAVQQEEPA